MKIRVVAITAKEKAELIETDLPEVLAPDEVRGKTVASLVSPGTELSWNYLAESGFPSFPGYASIFEANEIGSEVKGIGKGDLLFCMGGHQSYQQVKAENCRVVPQGLAAESAVLARLMGVSMTTLMTTAARPGDRVLVSGAGPVGFLAAQMFNISGYEVHVAEPHAARQEQVRKSGIPFVHAAAPLADTALAGTFALVVDCSGHEQAVLDGCNIVRARGEVVLVGVPWRKLTELSAHQLLHAVFHKYAILRTGWEWELPNHSSRHNVHSIFTGYDTALKWLAAGRISNPGLTVKVHPQQAQELYQALLHRKADGLFQVFDWSGGVLVK